MLFRSKDGELVCVDKHKFINDKEYYKFIMRLKSISKSKRNF